MSLTRAQVLSWRLGRHLLEPVGAGSVADVVDRLGAVPAADPSATELAVGLRRQGHLPGDVEAALAAGEVVRTYAFRGATHLLTPGAGAAYLALRTVSRMWERRSWQEYYRLDPADWPDLRAAVREALAGGPLTRAELAAALSEGRFGHLAESVERGADTLLKPMAWQGDLCLGPAREGRTTVQRLDASPGWTGLPDVDEAGRYAVARYLRAHGPATPGQVQYWLGEGLGVPRKRLSGWLADLEPTLVTVTVDGVERLCHADDLETLRSAQPTERVLLLPGHDMWVLGPGTSETTVVPARHRPVVSRGANLLVAGGVVAGTWSWTGDGLVARVLDGGPELARGDVEREAARVADLLDRPLRGVTVA